MVRLLGALMTGFACAFLGLRMRMTLKKRAESLAGIYASLEALESEISFGLNRLGGALERADRCGLLTLAAGKLKDKGAETAWREAATETADGMCLTDADLEAVTELGRSLGRTDSEDQIKNIRYVKGLVAGQLETARSGYSRYARLMSGGGILIGAAAVIILL